jgi:hypothetical protein
MPSPTRALTCEEREALQDAAHIASHLERLLTATIPLLSELQTALLRIAPDWEVSSW